MCTIKNKPNFYKHSSVAAQLDCAVNKSDKKTILGALSAFFFYSFMVTIGKVSLSMEIIPQKI